MRGGIARNGAETLLLRQVWFVNLKFLAVPRMVASWQIFAADRIGMVWYRLSLYVIKR
jgi:hypothetical protein